jgi:hypothetical protein
MIANGALTWAVVDPLVDPSWEAFVLRSTGLTVFHTPQWARVLRDSYRYRPMYLLASRGGLAVAAIALMEIRSLFTGRRGVSLPFTDFCDPLEDEEGCLDELAGHLRALGADRHWRYVELHGGYRAPGDFESSQQFYEHVVSLDRSEEELFARLRSSCRNNVRSAESNGDLHVSIDRSLDSMRAFYRLHCVTRRRHALPPQPFRFFKNIQRQLLTRGMGFIASACYRGTLVASHVYLHCGGAVMYKYGASDVSYNALNANKLLIWSAIKKCRSEGFSTFSFGRSEPDNKGLLLFKEGWGAEKRLRQYHRLPVGVRAAGTLKPGGEAGSRLMRVLPVFVLRGIGALMYRHFG